MIPLLIPPRYLGYVLNPARDGINSHGFRGPEIHKKNGYRICVVGDSCVYCDKMAYEDSWPSRQTHPGNMRGNWL